MNKEKPKKPKAFISYSWSAPKHEDWVVKLAEELVENGVDVILDKWSLREGDDTYAFMEQMVTDESIKKVICVSDRLYAEKADGREGGVGTETQIITPELYHKVKQQKFAAIVAEVNEEGEPYLPVFLKTRKYINMSDPDLYAKNFDQLLRWLFDEPLYRKPILGEPPEHIFADKKSLGTTSRYRQTMEALKQNISTAPGLCQDYFDTFAQNLEQFRIVRDDNKAFDDQVIENLNEFLPYRNQLIDVFSSSIARYRYDQEMCSIVHRFFEKYIALRISSNKHW